MEFKCIVGAWFLEIVDRDSGNKSLSNINMELLTWS